jgi:transposase
MSKARLVITAVVTEGRSQGEAARAYGVSQGWVSRLVARYRAEGEAAFEPRSRRPKTSLARSWRERASRPASPRQSTSSRRGCAVNAWSSSR